ncbi:DUF3192 domain-containing protein [Candidatus Omnitrophota bacterium]
MKKIIISTCILFFLTGCAAVTRGIPAAIRRGRMNDLKLKMTQAEVHDLMGKPYKTEAYPPNKEVWFYYTEWQMDGYTTDDEFTPIVFEDGAVVGWGWNFDFLKERGKQSIKQQRF